MHYGLVVAITAALVFAFLNGLGDSANVVATMISSRAMSARRALVLSTIAHLVAPFIFGVAVAEAIGRGVIEPIAVTIPTLIATLLAAILWGIFTSLTGIPASASHALIGGLLGAAWAGSGADAIQWTGLTKIVTILFLSPVVGFVGGYVLMKVVLLIGRAASPRINGAFRQSQIITAVALALSHGTNDTQMTMGIVTMALVSAGMLREFHVPLWVTAASTAALSLGTSFGGWRTMRTLGGRFYKIRPIHSFSSQIASAVAILGAALIGGPVSATHVISTSILGAGAAERLGKVRWNVVGNIMVAWLITIPASCVLGGLLYLLVKAVM